MPFATLSWPTSDEATTIARQVGKLSKWQLLQLLPSETELSRPDLGAKVVLAVLAGELSLPLD